jgi:hypothetical protein
VISEMILTQIHTQRNSPRLNTGVAQPVVTFTITCVNLSARPDGSDRNGGPEGPRATDLFRFLPSCVSLSDAVVRMRRLGVVGKKVRASLVDRPMALIILFGVATRHFGKTSIVSG